MQDLQNTPNGLIVVQPHKVRPGMGDLGRGPEINEQEAREFHQKVAAKTAKKEVAEAPEEPVLPSFEEFMSHGDAPHSLSLCDGSHPDYTREG